MKVLAQTLGVSRPNLIVRSGGQTPSRSHCNKAQAGEVLALISKLVTVRPTSGYRRITAILNRQLRADGLAPVNHSGIYLIMRPHNLLLARRYSKCPDHIHDGKVIVVR